MLDQGYAWLASIWTALGLKVCPEKCRADLSRPRGFSGPGTRFVLRDPGPKGACDPRLSVMPSERERASTAGQGKSCCVSSRLALRSVRLADA
jgi:hypothetical protein